MPSPVHSVPAWLAGPRYGRQCDAGLPPERWPSPCAERVQACPWQRPSMPSSRLRADGSPVRSGFDGDRLFLCWCLDWRGLISCLYRTPQPRPPGILQLLLLRGLGLDLCTPTERLAVSTHDGIAGLPRHHPTEPLPGLGSHIRLVTPTSQFALQVSDPLLSLGNLGL